MRQRLVLAALLAFGLARPCLAQEMTFEPEEETETADSAAEPAASESDSVLPLGEPVAEGLPRAVVLVIHSGDAEVELAQVLTESLSRQVAAAGKVEVMPSEDFHVRLFAPGPRAAQDCATNAVCLSGYGKELWLDKVIIGVLYKGQNGYTLNVDLVGVDRAEVEQYTNRELRRLATMSQEDIDSETSAMVFKLFGLRDPSLSLDGPSRRLVAKAGPVQKGMAWTAGGLAGVALVTGLVFGAQARSIQSELEGEEAMTQRTAQSRIDDGDGKALAAYMSFAAAGVLVVTSAALFLIKPLQEEEVEARPATPGFGEESSLRPLLLPTLGPDGAGVAFGLRF